MSDHIGRDTVFITSTQERKYEIIQRQNCVIIKKRTTPCVLPEYHKPRPISHVKKVEIPVVKEVAKKPLVENKIENGQPSNEVSLISPVSNSTSFAELQKKVEEMRNKEKQNQPEEDDVPIVTMEDADELAEGIVSEEQELINKKYLKSLDTKTLKKVYYVATGKRPDKDTTKFEMRKEILSKYKESNKNRKQVIYEASRLDK